MNPTWAAIFYISTSLWMFCQSDPVEQNQQPALVSPPPECVICLEEVQIASPPSCFNCSTINHSPRVCYRCLLQHLSTNSQALCPICRERLFEPATRPSFEPLNDFLHKIRHGMGKEYSIHDVWVYWHEHRFGTWKWFEQRNATSIDLVALNPETNATQLLRLPPNHVFGTLKVSSLEWPFEDQTSELDLQIEDPFEELNSQIWEFIAYDQQNPLELPLTGERNLTSLYQALFQSYPSTSRHVFLLEERVKVQPILFWQTPDPSIKKKFYIIHSKRESFYYRFNIYYADPTTRRFIKKAEYAQILRTSYRTYSGRNINRF